MILGVVDDIVSEEKKGGRSLRDSVGAAQQQQRSKCIELHRATVDWTIDAFIELAALCKDWPIDHDAVVTQRCSEGQFRVGVDGLYSCRRLGLVKTSEPARSGARRSRIGATLVLDLIEGWKHSTHLEHCITPPSIAPVRCIS
jgi:hypothetical protein